MADVPDPSYDGRPQILGKLQTERTKLISDDREDTRQAPGTKLYRLDPVANRASAEPSLTGYRRTLPSRALAYRVTTRKVSR